MSKIELEKTLGQIAQSIGTFNSTLITLKRGQDEVKDALMMFREMIAGMGNDYGKIRDMIEEMGVQLHLGLTDLGRIQMALPRLIKDAKALEKVRKTHRQKMARLRNKAASVTAQNDTQNVTAQAICDGTKESEKEQEESTPHTLLIEEREKEKEVDAAVARVCARDGMPAECAACECFSPFSAVCRAVKEGTKPSTGVVDVHKPPCLPLLMLYAHKVAKMTDDAFLKEFFQVVGVEGQWQHPKSDQPIHNWPRTLRVWYNNREKFRAIYSGKSVGFNGDIRGNQFGSRDRASNYLPPTEASIKSFQLPD